MIMLDMEVISFALDSSANQSAATGSEEQIKIGEAPVARRRAGKHHGVSAREQC